ncbi:hypothetical protein [Hymenobacter metallilatus]|uniref:Uncharacterized protein n=1 Tax=Hymenobacter metallilatus TaxID=2493666 RepID=A0A3R9LPV4_9BACT|nr:hypothetical protein [Hymenobacter metallilatus]RSK24775.1 hypothetical protein EI290_19175 [Hymenobacter metallilatus]
MNEAHLHLLLNHTPILGSLFGLLVLAAGLYKANSTLVRTGLVTLLAAAVLCLPTQLSGEGAEQVAKGIPGVRLQLIKAHEQAAELGFWALELTGAAALLGLMARHRTRPLALAALLGAILSVGLLARAGNLGGQIRHSEIR